MKFAVMGTGGVGGFFGAKLVKGGEEVWFVARGKHLDAMKNQGLRVESTEGELTVPADTITGRTEDVGRVDVVFFCVKSYDTETAASMLYPLLADHTIVISLQNGVDNEDTISRVIGRGSVYGGVAYIYATITAPGVVTETGGPKKIVFGPLGPIATQENETGRHILGILHKAGISAELTEDIRTALWKKFIFIASVAGLTSLTRLTLGEILAVHETRSLLADAMMEAEQVARLEGAKIEPGYIDTIFEMLKKFDNNTRSSLFHDLTHGKPMELDALSGTVLRYGKKFGVPTPTHKAMYAALLPYHLKHIQQQASRGK